jgi:predicted phage terminase large subunit-like protein
MNKNDVIKQMLFFELCRRDFWTFCKFYDKQFFSQRTFLKDVATAFQKIENGEIKSLSVSMPPRAGKSFITSLFCAWTIGKHPSESVMRNTCTATLYKKFSYDVRDIVRSEQFQQVFPNVRLSDDKSNLDGWNTNSSKQVGYFGAGVGGTIIGFGASKLAITDDLYRGLEDAINENQNARIIQWKQGTHDSRFESGCSRIDIGTRWTRDDLIGQNIDSGAYDKTIMIKALNENDESFCEHVMTTDEYLEKRKKTSPHIWLAEYQQTPIDLTGRLFGSLEIMNPNEFELMMDRKNPNGDSIFDGFIAYLDVADMGTDFTALSIAGISGSEIIVCDYVFDRSNTDVTIPMVASKLEKWGVKYCRVESNSMGAIYSRQLQKQTKCRILPVPNTQNKMTRIIMNSDFILNRMKFVKYDNPQSVQFIENVLSFSKEGKNKHDDAPDCLSGLSMLIQSMFANI